MRKTSSEQDNWWIVCAPRGESFDCESINDSDSGITKQGEFFDARVSYDPETASSSGATHVPSESFKNVSWSTHNIPCIVRQSRIAARHSSGTGTSRGLTAREGRTSTLFNSKNLATSSQELKPDTEGNTKRPEIEMRRESQNSSIHVPRFQRGAGLLNHSGGTYSHSGVVDYPRFPILVLHLGKFLDSMEYQSLKVNFKTEVCGKISRSLHH